MMQIPNEDSRLFGTRDFYLAATFVALGLELMELDRTDPQRVTFLFKDHSQRRSWGRRYFAGELRIDPLRLAAAIKALKAELHAR